MRVCVIGMGYVGLPLAVEFAKSGLRVTGIDVCEEKVQQINAGSSYILDVSDADLQPLIEKGLLDATADFSVLREADAVCICVPTPLTKTKDPDISYIVSAVSQVQRHLHRGMLVILESTTYPGTTDELLLPELEKSGLTVGQDFFLAFSPERVDPGNPTFNTRNTPKVVGGMTPECTRRAMDLYQHAVDTLVPVSSPRVAEMVKLLENTFRAVNIGLVNELAIMCEHLNVDVWEVVEAAKTKPFGFMPFYPGPGLGGHCIPIDPLYLLWKLRAVDYTARFIEVATAINSGMPRHVVAKLSEALNADHKSVNGSKILFLGVAYKKNIGDVRASPALEVIDLVMKKGGDIYYADPFVPSIEIGGRVFHSTDVTCGVAAFDCVVILTPHDDFDLPRILRTARLVYDTRNATAGIEVPPTCRRVLL